MPILCNWRAITQIRVIELGRREQAPTIFSDSQCRGYGFSRVVGYPDAQEGSGKNCLYDWEVVRIESYNCVAPVQHRYDRINHDCVIQTTHGTPGLYATLQECQSSAGGCNSPNICCPPPNVCVGADYCPPGTKCLPLTEWNEIQSLAAKNKQVHCG